MDHPTDDLAGQARGGDAAAYEALFARVAERLLVYVRCRMGGALRGRLDPVDVLQETYLEAHRAFPSFEARGSGAFSAWLYQIAEHRLLELARHHGAQKRKAQRGEVHASAVIDRLRAEETGPSTSCARREAREQLVAAMNGLDSDEREAVLLRYFRGLTLGEIGAALSTSERSVRRLLGRAQVKLGALLETESMGGTA